MKKQKYWMIFGNKGDEFIPITTVPFVKSLLYDGRYKPILKPLSGLCKSTRAEFIGVIEGYAVIKKSCILAVYDNQKEAVDHESKN